MLHERLCVAVCSFEVFCFCGPAALFTFLCNDGQDSNSRANFRSTEGYTDSHGGNQLHELSCC